MTKKTRLRMSPALPKTAIIELADTPTAKIASTETIHRVNALGREVPTAVHTPMYMADWITATSAMIVHLAARVPHREIASRTRNW